MNQCVPSWDIDENPNLQRITPRAPSNSSNSVPASLDYEVAELTWENGQIAMHGLGPPRVVNKPIVTSTWEKPSSGGTLESIVNQATCHTHAKSACGENLSEVVPWFNHHRANINPTAISAAAALTLDALVPCNNQEQSTHALESAPGTGRCAGGCSTGVGSCTPAAVDDSARGGRMAHVGMGRCKANGLQSLSVSESATCGGRDSYQVTLDTCELGGAAFTSTSPETSSGKEYTKISGDDHDSVCHSRSQRRGGDEDGKKKLGIIGKSSSSTKRSRAAAIHNQSERKRRDKINQRMKTLQKMVPNSNKTDKASMLDEVIEYLKQLQAQVHMMSRMSMPLPSMLLPLAMQQQLQMSMMGMGMGMGGMDMSSMGRATTMPQPATFMPVPPWDNPGDRMPTASSSLVQDQLNAFLACQSQPMATVDAYNRLAAMYQQFQQNPGMGPKN